MQFFSKPQHFDFMGKTKIAMTMSAILMLGSILSLAIQGLNFGLDFTGGTLIELGYQKPVELESIRTLLEKNNYHNTVVQHFGTTKDVMVRLAPVSGVKPDTVSSQVVELLKANIQADVELRRVEFVGPQVGESMAEDGFLAVLGALICVFIYVFFRFEWRFSLGAVGALIHDVLITVGVFSVLQLDFDLTVLAAVLAVIGYSLNDTIVVFDRIRENFRKMRKEDIIEVMDASLNQTLSRTIMTSAVTMLVVIAMFFFGGVLIHGFATALLIGIVVGTYSSIYIASTTALYLGVSKQDLIPIPKEGGDQGEGDVV